MHRDVSVPRVVLNLTYRVGSRDEDPERTGFAHLFEHLMFGGSRNVPDYDRVLQAAGGENNAFTNTDITNYYISLPSSQIELGFWVESDRMLELDFSQKILDVQKSVVIEEFKQRYLNKPYGDAHHILRAIHFTKHPYTWPTIGKEISHIEGASLDDVKDFFFGFYAPNNATLVIAGNFEEKETLALAEKWFGTIPERKLKKHPLPSEPGQTEARRKTVYKKVPQPAVYKMFHIPGRMQSGYEAIDIVTDLLSSGKASRLYNVLVKEKQICTSVRAFSWGAYDPGMVSVDAFLSKGRTVEEYEVALGEIFDDLQNLGEDELKRMKNMVESSHIFGYIPLLNRGMSLGIYDSIGDVSLINTSLSKYLALTLDEVKKAAKDYLKPENSSTLLYLPEYANA